MKIVNFVFYIKNCDEVEKLDFCGVDKLESENSLPLLKTTKDVLIK